MRRGVGIRTCNSIAEVVVQNALNYRALFYVGILPTGFSARETSALGHARAVCGQVTTWTPQDTIAQRITELMILVEHAFNHCGLLNFPPGVKGSFDLTQFDPVTSAFDLGVRTAQKIKLRIVTLAGKIAGFVDPRRSSFGRICPERCGSTHDVPPVLPGLNPTPEMYRLPTSPAGVGCNASSRSRRRSPSHAWPIGISSISPLGHS